MNGILLALQFFTVLPIRKELPLGRKEVTAMYIALPFVGAAIGLIMYGVSELLLSGFSTGTFLAAVFIVLTGILLTGGLHLDGWTDTADAFFSYQDREKRLEIMEDPRIGAFGTMALVFLILIKIAIFHEVMEQDLAHFMLFAAIPFLARIGMNIYFSTIPTAKKSGLAHFFQEKLHPRIVVFVSLLSGLAISIVVWLLVESVIVPLLLFILLAIGILLFRHWSLKHFGGVTGDLSGAFIEGMEVILWFAVLLFI
ncbi:adenosylcobinamide-GDP ribazoletransferase [Sporosarcina sp. Marseille-Q4063]|uniref:adenosylcobinamide-GDP ribazoletransferase n=1 Tax=Sporosarcina sp. Marseille-Q4063 TaxID=2810514 RepID=UPI001BAF1F04|nr:adenosylcobinamide-GDP ribazoletransferase [Sporosarcina sp. Marseille-Q4063]QUW21130.1 adenosylcobinamide-GDP ribazoletransferase [Sporosarcina sp. Marseille-Q4063]